MTLIRASLSSRTTGKAPDALLRLVDHFDQNRDAYHSVSYNEAQLRREFIDPLFEALGWDVENRQGRAMPYRDVIFEDSLKFGGATKARHDKMVELVTRMMELKKQQARAPKKQSPSAKQLLYQKLAITDHQIDTLACELYGLTEEGIGILAGVS